MLRRPRLQLADVPLHGIQRGNNRQACFFAEEDYAPYLYQLGELARKFDCAVRAYVLTTKLVYLLLTPLREDGVSLLMKHQGQRDVQSMNRSYKK
jgi:putative transposase